jgi:signal transduction histidine kinase
VGRDITHQRALEREVLQSQKLESIGRLAAGVAHDFNNLLMVVLTHAKLLLQDVSESNPSHRRLTAIESAATRCSQLCAQLLAVGGKQHLQPKDINLNDVISADEGVLRALTGPGVELILDLAVPIGMVYADALQIQRVLANLVTNASDAMLHGGEIVVSTCNITVGADDASYPQIEPGAYVRLSVSDSGTGLSEEVLAHMFEPFFTTKEPGKGIGLGLPTVYGIVTQSGGHVVVNSELGKGTRLEILLPERRDAGQEEVPPRTLIH